MSQRERSKEREIESVTGVSQLSGKGEDTLRGNDLSSSIHRLNITIFINQSIQRILFRLLLGRQEVGHRDQVFLLGRHLALLLVRPLPLALQLRPRAIRLRFLHSLELSTHV